MSAYYNEIDPYAAQWLRNLIKAGHIAPGEVDERSIEDVRPEEIKKFKQCHFFAGVGVWSYALRQAGIPDDFEVWTGSCPCQPFSAAGKGRGVDDPRHLWPSWNHLISQVRPGLIFGEQVASKDGLTWLDLVQSDMEGQGYAFGAADLCAAGVGAPHIRQRLYFVAENGMENSVSQRPGRGSNGNKGGLRGKIQTSGRSAVGGLVKPAIRENGRLADGQGHRRDEGQPLMGRGKPNNGEWPSDGFGHYLSNGALADTERAQKHQKQQRPAGYERGRRTNRLGGCGVAYAGASTGPTNGHWRAADWLFCRDGKWRPVEPGTFPLAHGASARVGRLRAYGNAIVAQKAQIFIEAYFESREERLMARRAEKR